MVPLERRAAIDIPTGAPAYDVAQVPSVEAMAGADGAHIFARECLSDLDVLHHKQGPSKHQAGLLRLAHAVTNIPNCLLSGPDRFHHRPELDGLERERRVRSWAAARKR